MRDPEDPLDTSGMSCIMDDIPNLDSRDEAIHLEKSENLFEDTKAELPSLSRASNKKRRKKLKLMKKALAAANAAQVLAECSRSAGATSNGLLCKKERRSKKKAGSVRTSKKKVANIALDMRAFRLTGKQVAGNCVDLVCQEGIADNAGILTSYEPCHLVASLSLQ